MTNDFNLNKVATLRGVEVINLNDLATALKPVVLPGEPMTVKVAKPGENPTQGVGYLDDGTMVVIEEGRSHIGQTIEVIVTSTLQTSAGRMIFAKYVPGNTSGTGSRDSDAESGSVLHEREDQLDVQSRHSSRSTTDGASQSGKPAHRSKAGRNPRR